MYICVVGIDILFVLWVLLLPVFTILFIEFWNIIVPTVKMWY